MDTKLRVWPWKECVTKSFKIGLCVILFVLFFWQSFGVPFGEAFRHPIWHIDLAGSINATQGTRTLVGGTGVSLEFPFAVDRLHNLFFLLVFVFLLTCLYGRTQDQESAQWTFISGVIGGAIFGAITCLGLVVFAPDIENLTAFFILMVALLWVCGFVSYLSVSVCSSITTMLVASLIIGGCVGLNTGFGLGLVYALIMAIVVGLGIATPLIIKIVGQKLIQFIHFMIRVVNIAIKESA